MRLCRYKMELNDEDFDLDLTKAQRKMNKMRVKRMEPRELKFYAEQYDNEDSRANDETLKALAKIIKSTEKAKRLELVCS